MVRCFASILCVLIVFCCSSAVARDPAHATGHKHSAVKVSGKRRSFDVFIPKTLPSATRVPLVIVLHGGLGSGLSARWDSRMSAEAKKHNFIVAYPNGILRTWNAGGCCGPARRMHVDDVAFIRELIASLQEQLPIDRDRVYVTGISNGGMMAYLLAEQLPDQIAAIAPIEACMYPSSSTSALPVSVVSIHGTKDRIIRYDGGTGSLFGYKVTAPKSVADTIQFWVTHDGCDPTAQHAENGDVVKDLYAHGKSGTEVCLYTVRNSGHVWPGGRRCIFIGDKPNKDFQATEAIVDFFLAHPKQHDVAAVTER